MRPMRVLLTTSLWLMMMAFCYGQQQEQTLKERIDSTMDKWNAGMSSPLNGKKFNGSGSFEIKSSSDQKGSFFGGKKKFGSDSFVTREFWGLKNPWFGKKVFATENAGLWSKSLIANADTKYSVKSEPIKGFSSSKKKVDVSTEVVETKTFIPKPAAQGALDATKPQLSINEVREILNKNH
jgi:hypothetical protein